MLAFNELTCRRVIGMAPSPIQLTEIEAFIRLYGPPQMPLDIFVELLREMDNEYLDKLSTSHGSTNRPRSRS